MNITTLFNITDAVYYHDKDGTVRSGTVAGVNVKAESDEVGGVFTPRPVQIQYRVYVNDGLGTVEFVNKFEADLTGTAPPPQG